MLGQMPFPQNKLVWFVDLIPAYLKRRVFLCFVFLAVFNFLEFPYEIRYNINIGRFCLNKIEDFKVAQNTKIFGII